MRFSSVSYNTAVMPMREQISSYLYTVEAGSGIRFPVSNSSNVIELTNCLEGHNHGLDMFFYPLLARFASAKSS
jgi:hypothetical protein